MRLVKPTFKLFSVDSSPREIEKHHMIVRAATDKFQSALDKAVCHSFCVFDNLFLIFDELGRHRFLESHCLCRDDVHKRTALRAGENGFVYALCNIFVVAENKSPARTAQSLVRG